MVAQTDIPTGLTDNDKALLFQILDSWLNSEILYALLYGIYTGILAVTLWNIFINKCWTIQRAVVVVIILLHALITINFAATWSYTCFAFIKNGQNFWTVYLILTGTNAATWVINIAASISTILADLYMIWCCWMVWGQHWLIVLLPIFSLVSAIILRAMIVYYDKVNLASPLWNIFMMLYISLNLVTTLFCTLLIIYHIVAVTGIRHGAVGQLGVYRYFIEVLVESSALYSLSLILYLAFAICNDVRMYYFDTIAAIAKGVAPTLLIGRAAAGHTSPRDDCDGSTVSSLHFQAPSEPDRTSSQPEESPTQSTVLAMDIEAQLECGLVVFVEHEESG
ncbi:hypothetical protein EDD85DRAFT_1025913 [Armillaria nabsnona]|nr:hypothetical protein EDD85DRAFT_1025913 [Armillaria nabsnona]